MHCMYHILLRIACFSNLTEYLLCLSSPHPSPFLALNHCTPISTSLFPAWENLSLMEQQMQHLHISPVARRALADAVANEATTNPFDIAPSLTTTYHTIVTPPDLELRDWPLAGLVDNQLVDSTNFNLPEDAAAVASALLTGLAVLLLTDLVFRLIVRADDDRVSTYHLFRSRLLMRAASPLHWAPLPVSRADGRRVGLPRASISPADISGESMQSPFASSGEMGIDTMPGLVAESSTHQHPTKSQGTTRFPRWQRAAIVAAGLALIVTQLALIFLATNRVKPYAIDLRALPAFALRSEPSAYIARRDASSCSSHSVSSKPGFSSRGTVMICTNVISNGSPDGRVDLSLEKAVVAIFVLGNSSEFFFSIMTPRLHRGYRQGLRIWLQGGEEFAMKVAVSLAQTRMVMNALFAARGHNASASYLDLSETEKASRLGLLYRISLNIADLPEAYLPAGRKNFTGLLDAETYMAASDAWNQHLAAIIRGQLELSGQAEAIKAGGLDGGGEMFLHDDATAILVERERPWLSVVACCALCGVLLILRTVVGVWPQWGTAVDYAWAWECVVASTASMSCDEFGGRPDVTIDFSGSARFELPSGSGGMPAESVEEARQ